MVSANALHPKGRLRAHKNRRCCQPMNRCPPQPNVQRSESTGIERHDHCDESDRFCCSRIARTELAPGHPTQDRIAVNSIPANRQCDAQKHRSQRPRRQIPARSRRTSDRQPTRHSRDTAKSRCTRSNGRSRVSSGNVVLMRRPRTTPCKPNSRIKRATVQRATTTPSRCSWRQTLRTP